MYFPDLIPVRRRVRQHPGAERQTRGTEEKRDQFPHKKVRRDKLRQITPQKQTCFLPVFWPVTMFPDLGIISRPPVKKKERILESFRKRTSSHGYQSSLTSFPQHLHQIDPSEKLPVMQNLQILSRSYMQLSIIHRLCQVLLSDCYLQS